ncbi:hypothetical protein [Streptomyces avidinii]|uniref:Transcriptional regulator n=1 Tax=Streptomyces avidinii TaxID=1895 RepID=A0ABS4KYW7_STRAV|nr:hypothetical protein [Streptomyces avidinii]MBP2035227.1 hypothetical protein [Streptomyces avidinii]
MTDTATDELGRALHGWPTAWLAALKARAEQADRRPPRSPAPPPALHDPSAHAPTHRTRFLP